MFINSIDKGRARISLALKFLKDIDQRNLNLINKTDPDILINGRAAYDVYFSFDGMNTCVVDAIHFYILRLLYVFVRCVG